MIPLLANVTHLAKEYFSQDGFFRRTISRSLSEIFYRLLDSQVSLLDIFVGSQVSGAVDKSNSSVLHDITTMRDL